MMKLTAYTLRDLNQLATCKCLLLETQIIKLAKCSLYCRLKTRM
jgi:hypothetical protein